MDGLRGQERCVGEVQRVSKSKRMKGEAEKETDWIWDTGVCVWLCGCRVCSW